MQRPRRRVKNTSQDITKSDLRKTRCMYQDSSTGSEHGSCEHGNEYCGTLIDAVYFGTVLLVFRKNIVLRSSEWQCLPTRQSSCRTAMGMSNLKESSGLLNRPTARPTDQRNNRLADQPTNRPMDQPSKRPNDQ